MKTTVFNQYSCLNTLRDKKEYNFTCQHQVIELGYREYDLKIHSLPISTYKLTIFGYK